MENSIVLTQSLLALAVFVAYKYGFLDAVMSVIPWYQRYLLGGLDNATLAAINKRAENREQAYLDVLEIIKKQFPTL